MSEALASSSATLKPGQQVRPRLRPTARPVQLGTRYLGLFSAWAVAFGLTFKSELLSPSQVWQRTGVLAGVVTLGPAFFSPPNRTPAFLRLDHCISPALVIVAWAALRSLSPTYRRRAL